MYSETLEPDEEEKNINRLCLAAAVLLLLNMPYIYKLCLAMPPFAGECIMSASYALIILLSYRVYTRFVCGYRYSFILEKQMKVLPRGLGIIYIEPGSLVIEKMYGSKVSMSVIILPDEVKGIAGRGEKEFEDFKNKTHLLNRKLFTNRGKKKALALMYERKGKNYICFISPSEIMLNKIKGDE